MPLVALEAVEGEQGRLAFPASVVSEIDRYFYLGHRAPLNFEACIGQPVVTRPQVAVRSVDGPAGSSPSGSRGPAGASGGSDMDTQADSEEFQGID